MRVDRNGVTTGRGRLFALLLLIFMVLGASPGYAQTGGINGYVVDNLGNVLSGASIRVVSGPTTGVETFSASDGSYLLNGLQAGSYTFLAQLSGYNASQRSFTVVSDVTSRVDFTLTSQTSQGGVLQGVVTRRDTGARLAGAQVNLTGPAGTQGQTTVTGTDGSYRFTGLVTATYTLAVSRTGFASKQLRISVTANRLTTVNVALSVATGQYASVQGTVTSSTGGAVSGATVRLSGGASAGLTATTNRQGSFLINKVVPDVYTLTVDASGFQTATLSNLSVPASQRTTVTVTLTPLGPATAGVEGFVVDLNGQVIVGARVAVASGPVLGGSSVTDSTGHYQISNLPSGNYQLQATATGYLPTALAVFLSEGVTTRQDFTLSVNSQQSGGTISGQVTDGNSVPISGATASVVGGPSIGQNDTTDANGNYSLENLPDGTYSVRFTASGYSTLTITGVSVVSGQVTPLNVQLSRGATGGNLTGLVQDTSGSALSGVTVTVLQGGTTVASGTTGTSGRYTLTGVTAGTYTVEFSLTGYRTLDVTNVRIQNSATTTLNETLSVTGGTGTGTVTGLVRDEAGRAAANVSVELVGPSVDMTTTTDADGNFEFDNVPSGTGYTVTISGSGIVTDSQGPFAVASGQTVNLTFTARVQSGGSGIAGVVRASNGLPISGAKVTIVQGPLVGLSVTTSSAGRYNFIGLPAGTYTLRATASGFRATNVSVVVRPGGSTFRNITLIR